MIDEELQEKMAEYDSMEFKKFSRYALRVKAMQSLGGLIAGMTIDDVIDDLEIAELRKWLQVNRKHFNDHQMKEVFALIEHILADGKVSNEEMEDLKWLAKRMVDHHDVGDLVTIALRILEGIFHGILADRQLSDYEVKCLCDWLEDTQFLRGVYPFDETQSLVTAVLADGWPSHWRMLSIPQPTFWQICTVETAMSPSIRWSFSRQPVKKMSMRQHWRRQRRFL